MKDRASLDLRKLAQDDGPIDELTDQLEAPSKDKSVKLWTDEFSASGEKSC